MNAATWTLTVSLIEEDGAVFAKAVLHAGGKAFEGSGTASSTPSDVVRPAPGAAQAAERALLDLVESIRCARLQRFTTGGFRPLTVNPDPARNSSDNPSHNGFRATHNAARRDQNARLAEFGGG